MNGSYKITLFTLTASLCLVIVSWTFFNWLPTFYIVTWMAGYMALVLLFSLLATLSWLKTWRLKTDLRGLILYCLIVVTLTAAAPAYSYSYAIRLARGFLVETGVEARMKSQDILIYDSMIHRVIMVPSKGPYRSVTTTYQVVEPVEQAEAKLKGRLLHVRGWAIEDAKGEVAFEALCTISQIPVTHSVKLYSDGTLKTFLEYGYPNYCSLG